MKNLYILNEFEKRSIIASLSDLNVINLVSVIEEEFVYYVAFYKFGDIIFAKRFSYSNFLSTEKPLASKFLERLRDSLSLSILEIEKYILVDFEIDSVNVFDTAQHISRELYGSYKDCLFCGFTDVVMEKDVADYFTNTCRVKLIMGKSPVEVAQEFFYEYKMACEDIFVKIINFKHPIEMQERA